MDKLQIVSSEKDSSKDRIFKMWLEYTDDGDVSVMGAYVDDDTLISRGFHLLTFQIGRATTNHRGISKKDVPFIVSEGSLVIA